MLLLQLEFLELLEKAEHPLTLVPAERLPQAPTEPLPEELAPPDPLTEEELAELRALPMPDPVEEIQRALALSTTPSSQPTSVG